MNEEEINARIARQIMKWGSSAANGISCWNVPVAENRGVVIPQDSWNPSTRIADAWKVLEKFPQPAYSIRMFHTKRGWVCEIMKNTPVGSLYRSKEQTAPMAICLACLKVEQND